MIRNKNNLNVNSSKIDEMAKIARDKECAVLKNTFFSMNNLSINTIKFQRFLPFSQKKLKSRTLEIFLINLHWNLRL